MSFSRLERKLCAWINTQYGCNVDPDDKSTLIAALADGVVLCKLIRDVSGNKQFKFHAKRPNVFAQNENIHAFSAECKKLGKGMMALSPSDLRDGDADKVMGALMRVYRTTRARSDDAGAATTIVLCTADRPRAEIVGEHLQHIRRRRQPSTTPGVDGGTELPLPRLQTLDADILLVTAEDLRLSRVQWRAACSDARVGVVTGGGGSAGAVMPLPAPTPELQGVGAVAVATRDDSDDDDDDDDDVHADKNAAVKALALNDDALKVISAAISTAQPEVEALRGRCDSLHRQCTELQRVAAEDNGLSRAQLQELLASYREVLTKLNTREGELEELKIDLEHLHGERHDADAARQRQAEAALQAELAALRAEVSHQADAFRQAAAAGQTEAVRQAEAEAARQRQAEAALQAEVAALKAVVAHQADAARQAAAAAQVEAARQANASRQAEAAAARDAEAARQRQAEAALQAEVAALKAELAHQADALLQAAAAAAADKVAAEEKADSQRKADQQAQRVRDVAAAELLEAEEFAARKVAINDKAAAEDAAAPAVRICEW
jgi:hypothetical protein